MRCKMLNELIGNEILARAILTDDFQTILPAGAKLKHAYIQKLKELNIVKVYIKEEIPAECIADLKKETENRIKEKVRDILGRHTYHHNEELRELCEAADNIISVITEEDNVIEQVFDIRERSADIYEHSLNLCTMAVLVALKLNQSENVVHDIGVGCLLHDIGLRYLIIGYEDQNLSSLSEADMAEFKKHPVYGYSALKDEQWISDIAKNIILYHHERLDGSGYPLRATDLSVPTQIVAVCDTFDEMICGIGCNKVRVHEAVEYLKTFKNIKFSDTIVNVFLDFTVAYPSGSKVVTNEGEIGIVIAQNREFPNRPVLRIIEDKDGRKVKQEVIKDLVKVNTVFIENVLE